MMLASSDDADMRLRTPRSTVKSPNSPAICAMSGTRDHRYRTGDMMLLMLLCYVVAARHVLLICRCAHAFQPRERSMMRDAPRSAIYASCSRAI